MNEQRLLALLRELPRPAASARFTAGVMARLDRPEGSARRRLGGRHKLALAVAAVAAVVLVVGLMLTRDRRGAPPAKAIVVDAQEMEQLWGEYRALAAELEELRLLSAEARPVVGVGGDQEYDYLVDLRDLLPAPRSPRPRPASYRPE